MALSDNTKGALLMTLAMASFTCNDALIKAVSPYMNVGQIILVRGTITFVLVYFIARHMGALRSPRFVLQRMVVLRILFEICAALLYITALGQIPLSNAASILQSLPLAVTLGAALFLGEPVGWRRWAAIIVGFIGVMIIIRPGPEGFTVASLYVVVCVFFTASRDLATKRIAVTVPSLTVTLYTTFGNAVVGGLLVVPLGGWQPLSMFTLGLLTLTSLLVFIGYQTIISAMRTGEISFIAPFRYTSLLWAIGLGMLFFNERPDIWTIAGAVIVICSGLYTFSRERKRAIKPAIGQESQPGSPL